MEQAQVQFSLANGTTLKLGQKELQELRGAVLDFLKDPPDESFVANYGELQARFIDEIDGSTFIIDMFGNARIAQWILEKDHADRLALVRHPPRRPLMTLYRADLLREQDGRWTVQSFGHQRVQALR